jgi:phage protein D
VPETSVSRAPIYRARPTLRLAGQEDARASELLIAMKMEEHEGGLSALELRFSNWASTRDGGAEVAFDARSGLRLGARIEVYAGDETEPREIFRGRISAIEAEFGHSGPPELVVLAEDDLQAARLARRSRTYTDVSPADIVRAIASDLGLRPVVTGLTAPVKTWAQYNESDLAFLRHLLARFDADLQIVGTELHVSPRADVERGVLELALYGQLARARVTADLAEQVTAVTVRGWHAGNGAVIRSRTTAGTSIGPGRGREGAAVLRDAFGERSEHVGHFAVSTDEEATALTQAVYDQRARRFVRIDGTAEGNARLRVGSHVRVTGLGAPYDNTYYVARACHLYDQTQGYRTDFTGECAYLGEP